MVVLVVVALVTVAMIVGFATDPGPSPGEAAIAYELAWDRLDFQTLWSLSGAELRDGLAKPEFVATKRAAYADRADLRSLATHVGVDEVAVVGDVATAGTLLELRDGSVVRNEVRMIRRDGRWEVVGYSLRPTPR